MMLLAACSADAGPEFAEPGVERPTLDPDVVFDPVIRAPTAEPTALATVTPAPVSPTSVSPAITATAAASPTEVATVIPTSTASATSTPIPIATPDTALRFSRPQAPNGQQAPDVATDPAGITAQILLAEDGLADPNRSDAERTALAHLQQVAYRKLAREDAWDAEVRALLPDRLHRAVEMHVRARRSLRGLHSGFATPDFIPAWEIIEPASAADLRSWYEAASADSGIGWEYLAAVNLLETGMGRINGLSSAGAQGPMQFLPTTWEEVSTGDINDPEDAIHAAAAYLVRRGGPDNMDQALWGYNNSDEYVATVQAYAELFRTEAGAFDSLHRWQIYFSTDQGDVWLPVGTLTQETTVTEFLAIAPWSVPDQGLRASGS